MNRKGLLIIFTGKGKGKTTAALGLALRALGHGQRVCSVQFVKSARRVSGEREAVKIFGDRFEIHALGEGFIFEHGHNERHREAALSAWVFASQKIGSGDYDLVILDEISYLLTLNYLTAEAVWEVLEKRPPQVHVCMTGRDMPAFFIERADLATMMEEIKHPFQSKDGPAGTRNIQGIDY
jgi:cob(I)alamin adenosyltransferase